MRAGAVKAWRPVRGDSSGHTEARIHAEDKHVVTRVRPLLADVCMLRTCCHQTFGKMWEVSTEGFYLSSALSRGLCVNAFPVGSVETLLFVAFCKNKKKKGFIFQLGEKSSRLNSIWEMCWGRVTLSGGGSGSVCFPLLLLCFLESLDLCLQDSLLVFGNPAEARLSLEAPLAVGCCCWGTGVFLAFFISRFSVELLVVLQGHGNKGTWSES